MREDEVVYKVLSICELGLYAESPLSYTEAGDGVERSMFGIRHALGGRVERFRRSSNLKASRLQWWPKVPERLC